MRVESASLVLTATKVLDGKKWGVHVGTGGQLRMVGGEVAGHASGGLYLDAGGDVDVKDVKLRKNRGVGVTAVAGAKGTFEGCDLSGNAGAAWSLADPAPFTRKGNKPNK